MSHDLTALYKRLGHDDELQGESSSISIQKAIQYANLDKERFAEEIQSHIEDEQTVDFSEQRKRMNVCEKRIGELEIRQL